MTITYPIKPYREIVSLDERVTALESCAEARAKDAAALRQAAVESDACWRSDEARGLRDSLGGVEYSRVSPAPRLRAIADRIDPQDGDAS